MKSVGYFAVAEKLKSVKKKLKTKFFIWYSTFVKNSIPVFAHKDISNLFYFL